MKMYLAGSISDIGAVQAVQRAVVAAGHRLTLDRSRGPDATLTNYALAPAVSVRLATQDLAAVLEADAVLVIAGEHDGRGMFVELGAALGNVRPAEPRRVATGGYGSSRSKASAMARASAGS
ncbi:MAG: hypothetical protein ACRCXL_15685 [Dermatophilaceae bacterium]